MASNAPLSHDSHDSHDSHGSHGSHAPEPDAPAMVEEALTIAAADGYALAGTRFSPERPAAARVLIGPATGVHRGHYTAFSRALARRGFEAVTFDYRGIGGSAPPRLRGFEASMHDWGARDLTGAVQWALAQTPDLPVLFVGHSVGGQLLPMAEGAERLTAILLVASQSGSIHAWTGCDRWLVELFWRGVVPVTTSLFGRLPGWAMGGAEDLPVGVARQWARWGLHPDYLLGEHPDVRERAARITVPTAVVSFDDDFYAPRASVDRLAAWYGPGGARRIHIHPRDLGVRAIGHFGCFRPVHRRDLWERAMRWLAQHVAGARPAGDARDRSASGTSPADQEGPS